MKKALGMLHFQFPPDPGAFIDIGERQGQSLPGASRSAHPMQRGPRLSAAGGSFGRESAARNHSRAIALLPTGTLRSMSLVPAISRSRASSVSMSICPFTKASTISPRSKTMIRSATG